MHGGAVPIRVPNVEGIVGVAIVSGLKQAQDHQAVIQGMEEYLESLNAAAAAKSQSQTQQSGAAAQGKL